MCLVGSIEKSFRVIESRPMLMFMGSADN
jgi:hypothetical protein